MPQALLNVIAPDGTRLFGRLPKAASWPALSLLFERIRALPRVLHPYVVTFPAGQSDAMLVGFTYSGYDFSIRERDGEYWFLVSPAECSDLILHHILAHCSKAPAGAPLETIHALEAYLQAHPTPGPLRTHK